MKEKICVLMSTYNGEQYLEQQIESILGQKGVQVELYVRDDGSSDRTVNILKRYQTRGLLRYYVGSNKGPAYSFWELILGVRGYSFYAFSDQDDVWLEDKLYVAITQISKKKPSLYFSKKILVDANLKELPLKDEKVRGTSLEFSLLRGFASGCTMVFNQLLYQELLKCSPKVMTMHDSWILKVAGAIGEVVYDKSPHMLYRQHTNNVVGNQNRISDLKRYLRNNIRYIHDTDRSRMARQLIENYENEMNPKDIKYTRYLADIRKSKKARFKLFFSNYLKTQRMMDIILFKVAILFGWL